MPSRTELGRRWEALAREHLRSHGLEVLEQGYRCRLGELDLVCRDRDRGTLVIVEVRARSRTAYASALVSIGPAKRRRIVQATRHLLMRHPEWSRLPLRFDVIAIDRIDTDDPQLEWVRNAFDSS